MRILADNALDRATITATNESVNYPPENLVHDFLQARMQFVSGTDNTITITFDDPETVNCLFFAYHNLGYMNIKVYAEAVLLEETQVGVGGLIYTEDLEDTITFMDGSDEYFIDGIQVQSEAVYFASTYQNVTSIVLEVFGPENSYIGGLGVGQYYQAPNPLSDHTEGHADNSVSTRSPYGQSAQTKIPPFDTGAYTFRGYIRSLWSAMRDLYMSLGAGAHVWVDFNEGNHDFKLPKYCTWDFLSESSKFGNYYQWEVRFTEAR